MSISIENLQWLEKTLIASEFKQKLLDLGYDDFVDQAEKEAKKSILEYRQSNQTNLLEENIYFKNDDDCISYLRSLGDASYNDASDGFILEEAITQGWVEIKNGFYIIKGEK